MATVLQCGFLMMVFGFPGNPAMAVDRHDGNAEKLSQRSLTARWSAAVASVVWKHELL
jgi:hypothetical protein